MSVRTKLHHLRRLFGLGLGVALGLSLGFLTLGRPALAEDIDLFIQPASPDEDDVPNVLIVLDNTANWSRNVGGQAIFINEQKALVQTVQNLAVGPLGEAKFRVGLMLFTETGNPNNNVDGGYVRAAVRPMTTANKTLYVNLLNSLHENNDKSNGGKAGKAMAEAYLYYDGEDPRSGNDKVKTDYPGNTFGSAASKAIYALPENALEIADDMKKANDGKPYNSPILPDSCAPNFIIFISNGAAQDNSADNTAATTLLQTEASEEGISGATNPIPISPTGSQSIVADEWARFMKKSPHKITTYTVDVDKITTGQGPGWTALLKSMANASDGKYFSVTSGSGGAEVANALGTIFAEIQAVNSVFASVSLPLSVSTQGTYLNQLYVGMFRPDADAMPRWNGNLKQYRLGMVSGELTTVDADGSSAINAATGFITNCARSYWSTADTYWTFRPQGLCPTAGSDVSNSPDGPITEKGAQAQRLRSSTTRVMKTCTTFNCGCAAGSCPALPEFNTTNVTDTMLGVAAANQPSTVSFQRGIDVNDEDIDANNSTEMRASAHGDVVHSRPVAINYGTDASPEVVVFYSANDGVLRAINGNRTTAIGTFPAGNELWSFVPFEFMGHVNRLRNNNVPINYQGSTTAGALPKPYGLDGTLTAYANGATKWIFATARRGGRTLHAFDVSNMDAATPSATLKWKIGCSNMDLTSGSDGCISAVAGQDFSRLAQTWSAPQVFVADGYKTGGVHKPMLMMGGGYDPCEDADPITTTCRDSSKGDRVYVIDADTGSKLLELPTDRGVAADVFVVPDPDTGIAKYAYVVDLGGNVYRIHATQTVSGVTQTIPFGSIPPANWDITKIASLGCDSVTDDCPTDSDLTGGAMNRKFLFSVDVLLKPGEGEPYNIMVGSGDREKPLQAFDSALAVQNHFFMIKDRPTVADWLTSEKANCDDKPVICLDSLYPIPNNTNDPLSKDQEDDLAEKKGWYIDFLTPGEQVVTSPITVFETVTFSTHEPTDPEPGACEADLGTARVYNLDYATANSPYGTADCIKCQEVSGGGLPPSPVAGKVILDDGTIVPFIIGADPDSPLQSRQPPEVPTSSQPKSLTYWFIER